MNKMIVAIRILVAVKKRKIINLSKDY